MREYQLHKTICKTKSLVTTCEITILRENNHDIEEKKITDLLRSGEKEKETFTRQRAIHS